MRVRVSEHASVIHCACCWGSCCRPFACVHMLALHISSPHCKLPGLCVLVLGYGADGAGSVYTNKQGELQGLPVLVNGEGVAGCIVGSAGLVLVHFAAGF
jgi:hypothetical protein